MTFVSENMKCYWTVNNSYWPPLHAGQYEVYCLITLHDPSTKVKSFTILKTKNQFILLCCKKKIKNYGICAQTFGSTLTMANFPAGWPRLNAKIHKHLNYCQTIADQKQKHQSVLIESIDMTLCVISFLVTYFYSTVGYAESWVNYTWFYLLSIFSTKFYPPRS